MSKIWIFLILLSELYCIFEDQFRNEGSPWLDPTFTQGVVLPAYVFQIG